MKSLSKIVVYSININFRSMEINMFVCFVKHFLMLYSSVHILHVNFKYQNLILELRTLFSTILMFINSNIVYRKKLEIF